MGKSPSSSAEKYLLDALNRVGKNSADYSVLYVNVSKLKPKNRHPKFVKIFARMFDKLIGAVNGMFFILSNRDFVILGKNITDETVNEAVKKLRQGLSSDPVLSVDDTSGFAHVYYFPEDFPYFYEMIERMQEQEPEATDPSLLKRPVDAAEIDSVLDTLDNIDIGELVKRQSVMRIKGAGKFEVLFQEFFVAVKDLNAHIGYNIDLVENRWLFLYLTQYLDKKTISSFFAAELQNWPAQISMNLNLSSVFSKEFVNFAKNFLKKEQTVIVELQLMDALNNLPLYFEAKKILKSGGHKILIDSMTPAALKMLNIKQLEPDYVKIFWEPLIESDNTDQELRKIIEDIGAQNVILAKCDSEKALRWGLSHGISAFQGPVIDNIETAFIKNNCPDSAKCSVKDCLKRKKLLSGYYRNQCTQKNCLETIMQSKKEL